MKRSQTSLVFFSAVVLAFTALSLGGCAPRGPQVTYEVETVEDQALYAIAQTPTVFTLPPRENGLAWERAEYFLNTYIGGSRLMRKVRGDKLIDVLSSDPAKNAQFRYSVARVSDAGKIQYSVDCYPTSPRGDIGLALRNARNLSRFLQEGTLEVSLLAR